jgi:hypothetical protein
LALASGFSAWWNFSLGAEQYNSWAKPAMLFDQTQWPIAAQHALGITLTKWLAVSFGVCSVLVLVVGSIHVLWAWR